MTYQPPAITGSILLNSNASATDLPGLTQSAFNITSAVIRCSAKSTELYARTPGMPNVSGITSDYVGHLFLNNYFGGSYLNLISGFIPNYYIDVFKNVKTTLTSVTGGITFAGGAGSARDRYEVIKISYQKSTVLTNLSGGTTEAITGLDIVHDVYPGNTYVSGDQIFYRKIGRLPAG